MKGDAREQEAIAALEAGMPPDAAEALERFLVTALNGRSVPEGLLILFESLAELSRQVVLLHWVGAPAAERSIERLKAALLESVHGAVDHLDLEAVERRAAEMRRQVLQ